MDFLGPEHKVSHSHTSTISVSHLWVCASVRLLMASDAAEHSSKLSDTTKQLLFDSFLQEIKVMAFIVPQLFHES